MSQKVAGASGRTNNAGFIDKANSVGTAKGKAGVIAGASKSVGTMTNVQTNTGEAISMPKSIKVDNRNPFGTKSFTDEETGETITTDRDVHMADFDMEMKGGYNVLHNYNLYNYVITLSSLSNLEVKDPSSYKKGGVEGNDRYIITRSGGYSRSNESTIDIGTEDDAGNIIWHRDKNHFKDSGNRHLDLFIDNLQFKTFMGVNGPTGSNMTTGSFEITEPHGVGGFYEALYSAAKFSGHKSYLAAPFLLTIEFIGRKTQLNSGDITTIENVPRSTRHFPIMITKSNMKVDAGGARYSVEFVSRSHQEANKATVTQLKDNINGPGTVKQTVGLVLYDLFMKQNELETKRMEDAKGESALGFKKPQKVDEKIQQQREAAANAAADAGLYVEPFLPHKWCIWFPEAYPNEEFSLKGLTFSSWVSAQIDLLNVKEKTYDQYNSKENQLKFEMAYKNKFSDSPMREDEFTYSGHFEVPDIDTFVEEQKKVVDEDIAPKLKKAQGEATLAQTSIKKLEEEIDEESKKTGFSIKQDQEEGADYYYIGNDPEAVLAGSKGSQYTQSDPGDVKQPTVYEAREKLQKLIDKLNSERERLNKAERDIKSLESRYKTIRESVNTQTTQKYKRYGDNAKTWNWKKGSTLDSNIHMTILDSSYATLLQKSGEVLNKIKTSHYIPWYKIEKYAVQRGYDTYYNQPVYEFHYCVVPYELHYSKIAAQYGIAGAYNYDKAYKNAVREYNYIFTGKNIDVLNFDLEYNNLFFQASTKAEDQQAKGETAPQAEEKPKPVYNTDPLKSIFAELNMVSGGAGAATQEMAATSGNSASGQPADSGTQIAKILHDSLYNATERGLLNAQLQIVGDPVYLIGSGIDARPQLTGQNSETIEGEANIFSRECDVIFNFRFPGDYPTANELAGGSKFVAMPQQSRYSGLYQVATVENYLGGGEFKQTLQLIRRPNQKSDYAQPVEEATVQLDEVKNPLLDKGDPAQQDKMGEKPVTELKGKSDRISQEELTKASEVGPLKATGNFISKTAGEIGSGISQVAGGVGTVIGNVGGAITGTIGQIVSSVKGAGSNIEGQITSATGKNISGGNTTTSLVDKAKSVENTTGGPR